ncbi:double zinc ribbon and ankyrin repeat-containing protein 1 [Pitangus sulphuratus]|nr:double zinc ribbon and ankyrin repeat-containing protein 1 [Pitangus sulphuratus]
MVKTVVRQAVPLQPTEVHEGAADGGSHTGPAEEGSGKTALVGTWPPSRVNPPQPGPPPSYFTCFKCGTSNQPYARFCASCGVYIEPPSRQGSPNNSLMDPGDSLGSSEAKQLQAQVAWQPHPVSMTKSRPELTEREDKGTQTIGLFYPSSKQLEKKELELISQKEKLEKMNDHKPLLTTISPGKGYWRKQLDHVCAHLRSYAQNNLEFRALIGEPRMGKCTFSVNYTSFTGTEYCFLAGDVIFRKSPNCIKMINGVTSGRCKLEILPKEFWKIGLINSATICEDDYEVTITLNYVLAINKDIHTNKPVKFSNHYLNTVTEVRDGKDRSQTSFGKDDCNLYHSRGKIKRTKSRTLTGQEDKLSTESRQLLDELGPNGKGRITFMEQLLNEGADPNCINDEDQPALTVAVLNKHTEAISFLVQRGADIDQQSGLHNNTALHEAVLLGSEGEECIRALLCCNANTQKKNAEGQLAYDLAVTTGNNEVISLFQVRSDRERWTNL